MVLALLVACAIPDLREPEPPVVTRVEATPNEVRYPVSGRTGQEVFDTLKETARMVIPVSGSGITHLEWRIAVDHATRKSREGCHLTQVVVKVDTTVFLPEWTEVHGASERDQAWWSDNATRREAYRAEQRGLVEDGAERLRAAVSGLDVQPCSSLTDRIHLLQKQERTRIKGELQEAADRSKQGELLPPGPQRTVH